jgi:hypothetical protein
MPATQAQFLAFLQALSVDAKTYIDRLGAPHPFIERLLHTIGWKKRDFLDLVLQKHARLVDECRSPKMRSDSHGASRIPTFCHKIWLTSNDDPHLPPADLLDAYLSMCKAHPAAWSQFFWTNDAHVLRHVSSRALAEGAKVLVLNIDGLVIGAIETTLRKLIADRKFVLAADVLKFVVLDRYGGIYSDLGVFYDAEIVDVASRADYTFLLASNVFFQTSWVSLAKGSLLSTVFLGVMNNPEILGAEYALDESGTVNAGTEVHTFAGLGFTTCALLFLPPGATCFAFPENLRQLRWRGQQSWYGDAPKFGNALINASMPSIFTQDKYAAFACAANTRLRTVNATGRLTEMAKIVAGLSEYFQRYPTRLCDALAYDRSDKVGGWHNYGYVYSFLMEIFAHRGCTILEVGDASSLWGTMCSGNTESSSGGSVRAWTEYLGAVTFGVQIDRSSAVGFSLEHPLLINQHERVALRDQLRRNEYDVIIDNGFHGFEPGVCLFEAAFGHLSASGIYVVEAVPLSDFGRWQAYFGASGKTAVMMSFPSDVNFQDNALVIALANASNPVAACSAQQPVTPTAS